MEVTQLALTWVGWPNSEKLALTCVQIWSLWRYLNCQYQPISFKLDHVLELYRCCVHHGRVAWPAENKPVLSLLFMSRLSLIYTILTKVSASHRKSKQVHVRPGQTESQVGPGFQLASTCDSIWPGLSNFWSFTKSFLVNGITPLVAVACELADLWVTHASGKEQFYCRNYCVLIG